VEGGFGAFAGDGEVATHVMCLSVVRLEMFERGMTLFPGMWVPSLAWRLFWLQLFF